jgi:glycosyltransferase involved in cell wall biosynthesis
MLVLHVVAAGEVGGAERMLVDLAQEAAGVRHAVALFSASAGLTSLLHDSGLTIFDRGPAPEGPVRYLREAILGQHARWLGKLARECRADLVHLHTFASQVLGTRAALDARIPIVRTEHSTRVFDDPSCWPFAKWSLERATRSVAISEHVAAVATNRAPWVAHKLRVVPNGVDPEAHAAISYPQGQTPRVALIGRLEPRKGVDTALDALAQVPGLELRIIGDGPSRGSLEAQTSRLGLGGRVQFLGHVAKPQLALVDCHAVVSASRKEGLGIALLEALAAERPVVALPTGGIPEFVDATTGYLAAGHDAAALAQSLRELVQDLEGARRKGQRGRERVLGHYTVAHMREGYARVYKEALSAPRRR